MRRNTCHHPQKNPTLLMGVQSFSTWFWKASVAFVFVRDSFTYCDVKLGDITVATAPEQVHFGTPSVSPRASNREAASALEILSRLRSLRRGEELVSENPEVEIHADSELETDSEPEPGPSGLSCTHHRALGSDGRIVYNKRSREEAVSLIGGPSKRSRSTSPILEKTIAEGRRRGRSRHTTGSSSEDKDDPEEGCSMTTHTLDYAPKEKLYTKYKVTHPVWAGESSEVHAGGRQKDKFEVFFKFIPKHLVRFIEQKGLRVPMEVHLLTLVGAGLKSFSCKVTPCLMDWYDLGDEVVLVFERPEPCADLLTFIKTIGPNGIHISLAKILFRQLVEEAILMEKKGIFHRDIRPDNVLVETGHIVPWARFVDFGSATTFTPGQMFDEPQGAVQYASPEWFREHKYTAGPTTVWQMGLLLYAMLFNRKPLINERTIASMRRAPIPRTIPEDCRDLLRGCLAKTQTNASRCNR
ncbi:hypothetical protein WMY93_001701 [Mugilogobius chulae]|uniref:non-specific serine/threonine protein kinase n=1 Tax=Mugilogobius chulae TaxID=88201 RepID=A0AAW0Q001_9GOBI